ncbi:hypothetical protein [Aurantimonas sp. VKM B-3413]|uniref:hypothetical protein n=1 Tax=Aurantimonas sp. VKM B-3413 TaxID=2779401 RepID=UPI001E4000E7|nr:hypothetical protein [Aurantimonas sp. VKM B-3413]MCB8838534.1 hypothetical protein [Aurantimonas sp. VKM B-3413]
MKNLILAATFVALGVSPVMAQSNDAGQDATTNNGAMSSSSAPPMSAEDMVASQKKVLKALETAGYTDAAIMDAAYMVQAQTPDGETVLMMIDTSGRVMGAQKAPQASGQSGSASGSDSSNSSSSDKSK